MKTTEQWKKGDGAFIPAPLVYINQMRWDGAEVPEMTVNVNVNFKDPALLKIEEDTKNVAPMPAFVREYIASLRKWQRLKPMQSSIDAEKPTCPWLLQMRPWNGLGTFVEYLANHYALMALNPKTIDHARYMTQIYKKDFPTLPTLIKKKIHDFNNPIHSWWRPST